MDADQSKSTLSDERVDDDEDLLLPDGNRLTAERAAAQGQQLLDKAERSRRVA